MGNGQNHDGGLSVYLGFMFTVARKIVAPQLKWIGPSGWITEELFLVWLNHFQILVKSFKEDPVMLFLDNHVTHCALKPYIFCRYNGIIIPIIPPHTSHRIGCSRWTFHFFMHSIISEINFWSVIQRKERLPMKLPHYLIKRSAR